MTQFANIVGTTVQLEGNLEYKVISNHVLNGGKLVHMDVEIKRDDKVLGILVLKIKPLAEKYVTVKYRDGSFDFEVEHNVVDSILTNGRITPGYAPVETFPLVLPDPRVKTMYCVFKDTVIYTPEQINNMYGVTGLSVKSEVTELQVATSEYFRARNNDRDYILRVDTLPYGHLIYHTNDFHEWVTAQHNQPLLDAIRHSPATKQVVRKPITASLNEYDITLFNHAETALPRHGEYVLSIQSAVKVSDDVVELVVFLHRMDNRRQAVINVTLERSSFDYMHVTKVRGAIPANINHSFAIALLNLCFEEPDLCPLARLAAVDYTWLEENGRANQISEWVMRMNAWGWTNLFSVEEGRVQTQHSLYQFKFIDETPSTLVELEGNIFNRISTHTEDLHGTRLVEVSVGR